MSAIPERCRDGAARLDAAALEAMVAELDPAWRREGDAIVRRVELADFAAALDRAIIETSSPRDFTFAGRTDFIRLEDVLQMLSGNAHAGVLSVERDDNRLDIYITAGHISFLDPHHMIRRVLPSEETMSYREISDEELRAAERRRAEDGTPTFLALDELGVFGADLRKQMAFLGREVPDEPYPSGNNQDDFHETKDRHQKTRDGAAGA